MSLFPGPSPSAPARLRELLAKPGILSMPCCFDALSARLIEEAGFPLTFMSGFAVAARFGLPDTGLISYGEMLEAGRTICGRVGIPVIGDADTGYGNAVNVKRTIHGYAQAGFACAMIEDQVAPKRCGHTAGKQVMGHHEAVGRIRAAVDAREEGAGILVMARTDARATLGLAEALERVRAFADAGADILFLEAPESVAEMEAFCRAAPGPKMANLLPQGRTPILPLRDLEAMGFKIAAYPLDLLQASIIGMRRALARIGDDAGPEGFDFEDLKRTVGFGLYGEEEDRYR